jgi:hypothetical protein
VVTGLWGLDVDGWAGGNGPPVSLKPDLWGVNVGHIEERGESTC